MTLRRPLARKNVQGCVRAAMRSSEEDDIRKGNVVKLVWFLREVCSSRRSEGDFWFDAVRGLAIF